jgi:hypothetical protein
MVHGNIFYDMESFKEHFERHKHGKIGMYAWHAKWHIGHQKCAELAREKCDYVIGVHYQNFGDAQLKALGKCMDDDKPWESSDLEAFKFSDIGLCQKDNYHPEIDHFEYCKKEFDRLYTPEYLKKEGMITDIENNLYASLFISTIWRCMFHEVYGIRADYIAQCGKDAWRFVGYIDWLWYKYGLRVDDIDAIRDEYGNVFSGMKHKLPSHLRQRMNKPLILPFFKTKDDVENHIKDIEGLHVEYFFRRNNWIMVKFFFERHQWWSEGLKLK